MKPTNFPGRKAQRLEESKVRDAERAQRSPSEQLELLDSKLGKGLGAVKERARLSNQLSRQKSQPAPTVKAEPAQNQNLDTNVARPRDRKGASGKSRNAE